MNTVNFKVSESRWFGVRWDCLKCMAMGLGVTLEYKVHKTWNTVTHEGTASGSRIALDIFSEHL